jgi:predicted acylesterase/phospholipase RssA
MDESDDQGEVAICGSGAGGGIAYAGVFDALPPQLEIVDVAGTSAGTLAAAPVVRS